MKTKTDPALDAIEILIVEDSPTQAEQLGYILEQRHYRVLVADSGKKALALLTDHKPSLVISDIIMPEMNGYELCRKIKSENGNLDIPVILLTSLSDSEDVLEGLACGADNFITKPYSEDYLLLHIEQILANQKLRKNERVRVGVEIMFGGKRRFITADQQQMLTLLISTYEAAVLKNRELVQTQNELKLLNEQLEEKVEKRTAALTEEVAVRKKNEEQIQNLNRVHSVLSNVNQTIVRVHDTGQLFKDICRIAIEDGRFQSAWIGKVNSGTRELAIVEFAGTSNEYRVGATIDLNDTNQTQTPAAISTRTGKNLIWNDVLNDATKVVRRKDGVESGSGSIAAFPIRVFGALYGVINLSSNEIAFFDEDEVSLLDEMAMDVSFALEFIEKEAERERAEEALRSKQIMLSRTEGVAHVGSWVWDIATDTVTWSDELFRIFQRDPREGVPSFVDHPAFYHPDDMARLQQAVETAVTDGIPYELELRAIRKDGETRACVARGMAEKEPGGRVVRLFGSLQDITERKRAEEALEENEKRYMELFDLAPIGYHELDTLGRITRINRTELDMLGYTKEEMIGQFVWKFVGDEDSSRQRVLEKMKGTIPPTKGEERDYRRKDGTAMPALVEDRILRDAANCIIGIRTTLQDITGRKRIENNLRASEERFRSVWKNSADGMRLTDREGRIVEVNEAYCRMVKIPAEKLVGQFFSIIYRRGGHDDDISLYQKRFKTEEIDAHLSTTATLWNDEMIDLEISSSFVAIPGHEKMLLSVFRNITERKKAEQKIFEQARLLDVALDAVIVRDMNDTLLYWNQAAERLYGTTFDEGRSMDVRKTISIEDRSKFDEAKKIFLGTGAWEGELRQIVKGEQTCVVHACWTMVRDKEGKPFSRLIIERDVTKQRQLEQELAQTQKIESIGTLASGIAHDFNNILGIILGYATLIERDPSSVSGSVASINTAVKRGAGLVRQILTFARKTDVAFGPLQVNEMIKEIVTMLGETFPRTIEFSLELGSDIPSVTADATQVHQSILNLCVNARDAMPNGGTLTLETEVVEGRSLSGFFPDIPTGDFVRIGVIDTGIGMDEKTRTQIFDPFFTTKEIGKGTGLGLSVVYGVMREHQGYVHAESAPGKGSEFSLYFPTAKVGSVKVSEKPADQWNFLGGRETLLIVEDEEALIALLKVTLEATGYHIFLATDGLQALEVYRAHRAEIDLVLTDMGLPKITGEQLFFELRMLNPAVKVVIASGYLAANARSEILKAGVKDFVQKPYSPDELLKTIREVLDQRL